MVLCAKCSREMKTADGCDLEEVTYNDGTSLPAVRAGDPREGWVKLGLEPARCHDCGAQPGHFHHPGCDVERCPRCEGQLITCGCLDP